MLTPGTATPCCVRVSQEVRRIMAEVDREGTGTIEFPEFLSISKPPSRPPLRPRATSTPPPLRRELRERPPREPPRVADRLMVCAGGRIQ